MGQRQFLRIISLDEDGSAEADRSEMLWRVRTLPNREPWGVNEPHRQRCASNSFEKPTTILVVHKFLAIAGFCLPAMFSATGRRIGVNDLHRVFPLPSSGR